jgi:hypothetical protein
MNGLGIVLVCEVFNYFGIHSLFDAIAKLSFKLRLPVLPSHKFDMPPKELRIVG